MEFFRAARHPQASLYFSNVLIVPGGRNYFLAADAPLDIQIGSLMAQSGVETVYVNQDYVDDRMLEERSQEITAALLKCCPGRLLHGAFVVQNRLSDALTRPSATLSPSKKQRGLN